MGVEKALMPLAGRPVIAHVIERLQPQCGALALNANGDPMPLWSTQVIDMPGRQPQIQGLAIGPAGNLALVLLSIAAWMAVVFGMTPPPVDTRGLQAVIPGGAASQGSRGGRGAFSGSSMRQQFSQLSQSQETLTTLAADTGGTAFTDTNDFGAAFTKVQRDISAYYILGYSSTNTKQDGSFRKIQVRLKKKIDAKLTAREGYYADRDFANTSKADRENQLQEQLLMPIPVGRLTVATAAAFQSGCEDWVTVPAKSMPGIIGKRRTTGARPVIARPSL